MYEVDFQQVTIKGDKQYILLDGVLDDVEVSPRYAYLFHFSDVWNFGNALKLCDALNEYAADIGVDAPDNLNVMTGEVDNLFALIFKHDDSTNCIVAYFSEKKDFETACEMAMHFLDLATEKQSG